VHPALERELARFVDLDRDLDRLTERQALVDVFAARLYKPNDDTDERALDLLEQLAGDVVALQAAVRAWAVRREARLRDDVSLAITTTERT